MKRVRSSVREKLFRACLFLLATSIVSKEGWSEAQRLMLDEVRWQGSERLPEGFLSAELGLKPGASLSEEELAIARTRLLGTGLFRSVHFFLKKGRSQGHVALTIESKDEPSVLGPWALGSYLGLAQDSREASRSAPNQLDPLAIKGQLISRNLFAHLHRAAIQLDSDGGGQLRAWQLAYGLPRFSAEDVQFDASLEAADARARYFEVLGFGSKAQVAWSLDRMEGKSLKYGVALYSNHDRRMRLPGYPKTVAGPKLGLQKETRLLSFRTSEGYAYHIEGVLTSEGWRSTSLEMGGAYTHLLWSGATLTFQSDALSVGGLSLSARHSLRWEQALPVWKSESDPLIYMQGSYGHDRYEKLRDQGYEGRVGLRFHSSGFIADLALSYSRLPDRLESLRDGEGAR